MNIQPNRVATGLAIAAGIAGAIAPVVGNMDWSSTAGVESGVIAIVVAVCTWLVGWQKHEARQGFATPARAKPKR